MNILSVPAAIGSLKAERAAAVIEAAARSVSKEAEIVSIPLPTGGKGLISAFKYLYDGEMKQLDITLPDGETGTAAYLVFHELAVIEAPSGSYSDGAYLTSAGTGEMLLDALKSGASEIYIGIDTNPALDAGMGLLDALGAAFYTKSGRRLDGMGAFLTQIDRVDLSQLTGLLSRVNITAVTESTARLSAIPAAERLSSGYDNLVSKIYDATGSDISAFDGSGAGGGLAAALCGVLRTGLQTGACALLDLSGFDDILQGVDIVITAAERSGDACAREVSRRCANAGVPCFILTCAETEANPDAIICPIVNAPMSWDNAILQAESLLSSSVIRLLRTIKTGGNNLET